MDRVPCHRVDKEGQTVLTLKEVFMQAVEL